MLMALRGEQPAPAPDPSRVGGTLNQTLIPSPNAPSNMQEGAEQFSQQSRHTNFDPLQFAIGLAGGPRAGRIAAVSRWGEKDWEPFRQARAQQQGFTTDVYHGTTGSAPWTGEKIDTSLFFSTPNPHLAGMYARTNPPGVKPPVYSEKTPAEGANVLPLKANTKDYHVFDARGGSWVDANRNAIREAQEAKKPGVIIKNVLDEPGSPGGEVLPPQDVVITLDPSTLRSRFAKFDPRNVGQNNLVGGLGGIAAMTEALRSGKQEQ